LVPRVNAVLGASEPKERAGTEAGEEEVGDGAPNLKPPPAETDADVLVGGNLKEEPLPVSDPPDFDFSISF
jgi:hypothetical protein